MRTARIRAKEGTFSSEFFTRRPDENRIREILKALNEHRNETSRSPFAPHFRIFSCGMFRVEMLIDANTMTYEPVRTAQWGGSNYPRLLLKALICCPGRRVRREALLEMLWPEVDVGQAIQYLNTGATKLRNLLRPGKGDKSLLVTEENARFYCLEQQPSLWIDIDAIPLLLRDAERIGRTSSEALTLEEKAATYLDRGLFLEGEDRPWLQKQRKSMVDARYQCQLWLADAYEQQGMPGQAENVLSALLAENPVDEDVLYRLMELLHRHDMTHKACRIFEEIKHQIPAGDHQFSATLITFAEKLCNEPRAVLP